MQLNISGMNLRLLGDPHIGRRFTEGVPLNRRGEREKSLLRDIQVSLRNLDNTDFHICLGDIFDGWFVPYDLILEVAKVYKETSEENPQTQFVILAGNHDLSKDLTRKSAFDVLKELLSDHVNIWVVDTALALDGLAFFPWSPTVSAEEMVESFAPRSCLASFHHCDTDPRTTNGNLIPTKALAELGIPVAFTGHVHQRGEFIRDGVRVVQVGSMQPYAHGEGDMYVSLSKEGVEDRLHNYGADWFKDKCIRVDLDPTEVWDLDLDCLQIQVRKDRMEDVSGDEVSLDGFDLNTILGESLSQFGIPDDIKAKITDKFSELRA